MKKKIIELLMEYVQGNISRNRLIEVGCQYINLRAVNTEAQIYYLLKEVFDDPEDNLLRINRKNIIHVINNYSQKFFSLEEFQLWFWDVLNLNIEGDESEQELISYLLYTFDNLDINEINGNEINRIHQILEQVSNAKQALKEIEKTLAR